MKNTGVNPLILAMDLESAISLFEDLGFEKSHIITINECGKNITSVCMRNAEGESIDLARVEDLPDDITLLHMDEEVSEDAYEFFSDNGSRDNCDYERSFDTRNDFSSEFVSTSGFAFDLCQYYKN